MGYTHYFTQTRNLTQDEWDLLARETVSIIKKSGIDIVDWDGEVGSKYTVDNDEIIFNGSGEDSHETFALSRIGDGFSFCKTAGKDYDVVVTAVLSAVQAIAPGAYAIASDGDQSDWEAGIALADYVMDEDVAMAMSTVFADWAKSREEYAY